MSEEKETVGSEDSARVITRSLRRRLSTSTIDSNDSRASSPEPTGLRRSTRSSLLLQQHTIEENPIGSPRRRTRRNSDTSDTITTTTVSSPSLRTLRSRRISMESDDSHQLKKVGKSRRLTIDEKPEMSCLDEIKELPLQESVDKNLMIKECSVTLSPVSVQSTDLATPEKSESAVKADQTIEKSVIVETKKRRSTSPIKDDDLKTKIPNLEVQIQMEDCIETVSNDANKRHSNTPIKDISPNKIPRIESKEESVLDTNPEKEFNNSEEIKVDSSFKKDTEMIKDGDSSLNKTNEIVPDENVLKEHSISPIITRRKGRNVNLRETDTNSISVEVNDSKTEIEDISKKMLSNIVEKKCNSSLLSKEMKSLDSDKKESCHEIKSRTPKKPDTPIKSNSNQNEQNTIDSPSDSKKVQTTKRTDSSNVEEKLSVASEGIKSNTCSVSPSKATFTTSVIEQDYQKTSPDSNISKRREVLNFEGNSPAESEKTESNICEVSPRKSLRISVSKQNEQENSPDSRNFKTESLNIVEKTSVASKETESDICSVSPRKATLRTSVSKQDEQKNSPDNKNVSLSKPKESLNIEENASVAFEETESGICSVNPKNATVKTFVSKQDEQKSSPDNKNVSLSKRREALSIEGNASVAFEEAESDICPVSPTKARTSVSKQDEQRNSPDYKNASLSKRRESLDVEEDAPAAFEETESGICSVSPRKATLRKSVSKQDVQKSSPDNKNVSLSKRRESLNIEEDTSVAFEETESDICSLSPRKATLRAPVSKQDEQNSSTKSKNISISSVRKESLNEEKSGTVSEETQANICVMSPRKATLRTSVSKQDKQKDSPEKKSISIPVKKRESLSADEKPTVFEEEKLSPRKSNNKSTTNSPVINKEESDKTHNIEKDVNDSPLSTPNRKLNVSANSGENINEVTSPKLNELSGLNTSIDGSKSSPTQNEISNLPEIITRSKSAKQNSTEQSPNSKQVQSPIKKSKTSSQNDNEKLDVGSEKNNDSKADISLELRSRSIIKSPLKSIASNNDDQSSGSNCNSPSFRLHLPSESESEDFKDVESNENSKNKSTNKKGNLVSTEVVTISDRIVESKNSNETVNNINDKVNSNDDKINSTDGKISNSDDNKVVNIDNEGVNKNIKNTTKKVDDSNGIEAVIQVDDSNDKVDAIIQVDDSNDKDDLVIHVEDSNEVANGDQVYKKSDEICLVDKRNEDNNEVEKSNNSILNASKKSNTNVTNNDDEIINIEDEIIDTDEEIVEFSQVSTSKNKSGEKNIKQIEITSDSEKEDQNHSEDDNSSASNVSDYIENEAMENSGSDTPSVDSNEIVDIGEFIGHTDSEDVDDEESDYENNSFVVSDDDNDLLSGTGDDLSDAHTSDSSDVLLSQAPTAKKAFNEKQSKKSRIISLDSSSSDDEVDIVVLSSTKKSITVGNANALANRNKSNKSWSLGDKESTKLNPKKMNQTVGSILIEDDQIVTKHQLHNSKSESLNYAAFEQSLKQEKRKSLQQVESRNLETNADGIDLTEVEERELSKKQNKIKTRSNSITSQDLSIINSTEKIVEKDKSKNKTPLKKDATIDNENLENISTKNTSKTRTNSSSSQDVSVESINLKKKTFLKKEGSIENKKLEKSPKKNRTNSSSSQDIPVKPTESTKPKKKTTTLENKDLETEQLVEKVTKQKKIKNLSHSITSTKDLSIVLTEQQRKNNTEKCKKKKVKNQAVQKDEESSVLDSNWAAKIEKLLNEKKEKLKTKKKQKCSDSSEVESESIPVEKSKTTRSNENSSQTDTVELKKSNKKNKKVAHSTLLENPISDNEDILEANSSIENIEPNIEKKMKKKKHTNSTLNVDNNIEMMKTLQVEKLKKSKTKTKSKENEIVTIKQKKEISKWTQPNLIELNIDPFQNPMASTSKVEYLPESLLNTIATPVKTEKKIKKRKHLESVSKDLEKKKKKKKTFTTCGEVEVVSLSQKIKPSLIGATAYNFKQEMLFGNRVRRQTSEDYLKQQSKKKFVFK